MYSPKDWRPSSILVWLYLIEKVEKKRLLFFQDVAKDVGISQRYLNSPLSYIMEFCERETLPPLTGIVIHKHEFLRRNRAYPSAHFRIKHKGKYYFYGDESFEELYQNQLNAVKEFNWNSIVYQPSSLDYIKLNKQLLEAKKHCEIDKKRITSLTQLTRRSN